MFSFAGRFSSCAEVPVRLVCRPQQILTRIFVHHARDFSCLSFPLCSREDFPGLSFWPPFLSDSKACLLSESILYFSSSLIPVGNNDRGLFCSQNSQCLDCRDLVFLLCGFACLRRGSSFVNFVLFSLAVEPGRLELLHSVSNHHKTTPVKPLVLTSALSICSSLPIYVWLSAKSSYCFCEDASLILSHSLHTRVFFVLITFSWWVLNHVYKLFGEISVRL
jgi:hypothetical protein